jgi:ABC-type uncharacterized transport system substrate-binding protein
MALKGKACCALLATLGSPFSDRLWMTRCSRLNTDALSLRCTKKNADAVIVGDASTDFTYRKEIIALTNELRLPTMFPYRKFVDEGGLVAYAVEVRELWRRAAHCVDQLLRGARIRTSRIIRRQHFG